MKRRSTGRYEITAGGGEQVRAFVPDPLPPKPPLDLLPLQRPLERALLMLGRLDGLSTLVPNTGLFLYFFVRKEAVLSSQIEGTQSSLSDLLLFELEGAPGVLVDDVAEVSNYVTALEHGLKRLDGGFPLSNRLVREVHGTLMRSGRGNTRSPGEFRRSQNWIGGSRPGNAVFAPPPAHAVADCMSDLERFLHDSSSGLPSLVRAGLAHAQFETIHPFLDGNGRVGRLLITLLLRHDGVLEAPLLYLSLYLKQHRDVYYSLLDGIRRDGDWEAWLRFFLNGVAHTAQWQSQPQGGWRSSSTMTGGALNAVVAGQARCFDSTTILRKDWSFPCLGQRRRRSWRRERSERRCGSSSDRGSRGRSREESATNGTRTPKASRSLKMSRSFSERAQGRRRAPPAPPTR